MAAMGGCGDADLTDGPLTELESEPHAAAGSGSAASSSTVSTSTAATATVTGRWFTRCKQGTFLSDLLYDLRTQSVRALIPDDSPSGYRVIVGTGNANSTFSIPGVPVGISYVLNLGIGYYVTDQHVLDVHDEPAIRCAPAPSYSQQATPVTFDLAGLTPFSARQSRRAHHTVELVSHSLGSVNYSLINDQLIGQDDTAIDATIDWGIGYYLPDARLNDDVHVLHRKTEYPLDPLKYRTTSVESLVDLFRARGLSIQDGVPATIAGTFQNLTPNRSLSLSIDRAPFEANYDGTMQQSSIRARVVTERGEEVVSVDMGSSVRGTSTVNTLVDGAYADPFPTSMKRFSIVQHFASRLLRAPGGQTWWISLNNYHRRPFPGPIDSGPILQAPSQVQLSGLPFLGGGLVPLASAAPVTVSWSPVAGVTSYKLEVRRVTASSYTTQAIFRTVGTSLAVPASLFVDGSFYVLSLGAVRAANLYHKGQILPVDISSNVELLSGRFRFSSSCGDGVVQSGEDCDAAGASALCNVDCTASSCGDGLRNPAAGEACDGAGDVIGCDRDCTLSTCGDGYRNYYAREDCDDGNTTDDGNGCGGDCEYDNVCGNSVVESAVEGCDAGGVDTATCTAECVTSYCGDGYVNPVAGEECDDGFFDHRRCDSSCRWNAP